MWPARMSGVSGGSAGGSAGGSGGGSAGGTGPAFSTPQQLSNSATDSATAPKVVCDSTGICTAVWIQSGTTGKWVMSTSSAAGGDGWAAPVKVSFAVATDLESLRLLIDSAGVVTAAWIGDGQLMVKYETAVNGGYQLFTTPKAAHETSWRTPVPLSAVVGKASDLYTPALVGDVGSSFTAMWKQAADPAGTPASYTTQTNGNLGDVVNMVIDSTNTVTAFFAIDTSTFISHIETSHEL